MKRRPHDVTVVFPNGGCVICVTDRGYDQIDRVSDVIVTQETRLRSGLNRYSENVGDSTNYTNGKFEARAITYLG